MKLEQIEDIIKKEGVKAILLQFSDLTGNVKVVETEVSRLKDVVTDGEWYDGSSVEGHARIYESDMLLKPDLETFAILPWTNAELKSARIICNICTPDGQQFTGDPRYILRKVLEEAKEMGFDYYTAAELEFFLFERENLPQLTPHDRKGYFDYTPVSRATRICRKVMDSLKAFNVRGESYHHEVAEGQHEIDIHYDKALQSADNVLTVKSALKAYTNNESLKVTFMPKPLQGINGSGMHVHQSLFKDSRNYFYEEKDQYQLSKTAYHFLAGQLHHARALAALVAPTVNSYKRLVPGYEAPVNICWGRINRSALIRIPKISEGKKESTRIELRCPDPSANPYLAFAGMLACGLDGIRNKIEPPKPIEENVYLLTEEERLKRNIGTLPSNLEEAITELGRNEVLKDLLGNHASKAVIDAARNDIEKAKLEVTPWEIKRYL
ncbi:MAG: glutamine synthetase [Candidatus Kerfeldbacteria bacterium CG08_land_8_20_14_0_20_40_16]|uniref:Glutamine synthetase n=1 Tax=Candidatus Kerfeldbacteria bacterium CG08_land_8_20_14_0_20_40_16 TaxID=2014244 RepID=A0A2H0YX64_9BACT|nr:MAG: glutamine synthetase [Candidatus Kerfeldbacteria bacterium CG08_land_8_20_14_0_20_40_16]